jgi:hypothetical protein
VLRHTSQTPEIDQPYANWTIRFATDKLALAQLPDGNKLRHF